MPSRKKVIDPIPESFATLEEAGEFWDTHDLADYWDQTKEVQFDVQIRRSTRLFAVERDIANQVADEARKRGISTETLVNLWLSEKLHDLAS